MKQGTPEWLELRKRHLGASDAPIVMRVSPWKTPFQLWEEKVGLSGPQETNRAMAYGNAMEEPARQAYERYTNNLVMPEVIFHPEHKFMMASLDGLSINGDIILEIKNPGREDHEKAENGEIPDKYWPQLQHQLDCLPGSVLHYWSFRNGQGVLIEVERDAEYTKKLVSEERGFWNRVMGFEAPDLLDGDFVEFIKDEEWLELAKERVQIDHLQKELKEREKANREALMKKAEGRSARGHGVRFTRFIERGRVDYSSIPQLQGIDLDSFRKPHTEKWRISVYE